MSKNLTKIFPLIVLISIPFLNNCSGLLSPIKQHTIHTFILNPQTINNPICNNPKNVGTLQVFTMKSEAPYDTRKMIYSTKDSEITTYSFNEWATNPNSMLSQSILDKLGQACLYKYVVSEELMTSAPYRLNSKLVSLIQKIEGSDSEVDIVVSFQLIDNTTNLILNSKTFKEITKTKATPEGYVSGFSITSEMILKDLTNWLSL